MAGVELAPASPPSGSITLAPARVSWKYRVPRIQVGGVPIIAQSFEWGFVPGPLPFRTTIIFVQGYAIAALRAVQNPTTITIDIDGAINDLPAPFRITLSNVWITEPRKIDPFHWSFEVADLRVRWEGRKATWTANRTWRVNIFGDALPELDPDDPARVQEQFQRFERFRYLPWSRDLATDGRWTARALLLHLLKKLEGAETPEVIGVDNQVVVENWQWEEEPVQAVLAELCTLSRTAIGVTHDGSVYVYPQEEIPGPLGQYMPTTRPPIQGGVLYKQDLSRIRPQSVKVKFRKRREVLVVGIDIPTGLTLPPETPLSVDSSINVQLLAAGTAEFPVTQDDINSGRVVPAFNVVEVPYDVVLGIGTAGARVLFQRKTFAPMHNYLNEVDLGDSEVRTHWWDGILEHFHAVTNAGRGPGDGPDEIRLLEALAIRASYRQLWQIDPYWVQRWESWDTKRAALVDPVTRFSLDTPVWTDACWVPKVMYPLHSRGIGLWSKSAFNIWAGDDANRERAFTAAELSIVNPALGVFRVGYPRFIDRVIAEVIPTAVDNPPNVSAGGDVLLWTESKLTENHTLEAVISVTPAVDDEGQPSDARFLTVHPNPGDGQGPVYEWLVNEEVARYPHPVGIPADAENNLREVAAAGLPSNLGVLLALAQAQSAIVMHSFRDRISGFAIWPGANISRLKLFGPCKGIYVKFDSRRGLSSTYDLREAPPTPTLHHRLPDSVYRYVYRLLQVD